MMVMVTVGGGGGSGGDADGDGGEEFPNSIYTNSRSTASAAATGNKLLRVLKVSHIYFLVFLIVIL